MAYKVPLFWVYCKVLIFEISLISNSTCDNFVNGQFSLLNSNSTNLTIQYSNSSLNPSGDLLSFSYTSEPTTVTQKKDFQLKNSVRLAGKCSREPRGTGVWNHSQIPLSLMAMRLRDVEERRLLWVDRIRFQRGIGCIVSQIDQLYDWRFVWFNSTM